MPSRLVCGSEMVKGKPCLLLTGGGTIVTVCLFLFLGQLCSGLRPSRDMNAHTAAVDQHTLPLFQRTSVTERIQRVVKASSLTHPSPLSAFATAMQQESGRVNVINADPPVSERNALKALYIAASGSGWKKNRNWMKASLSVCLWYGVTCSTNTSTNNTNVYSS